MCKKILIIDSDEFYKKILTNVFEKDNCDFVKIDDFKIITKLLIENEYVLIILEFMPSLKVGKNVLEFIQNNEIEIPVIVTTDETNIKIERLIRSFGPAYFFVKPFSMADMQSVVDKIFKKKILCHHN